MSSELKSSKRRNTRVARPERPKPSSEQLFRSWVREQIQVGIELGYRVEEILLSELIALGAPPQPLERQN
ncbi:MAG TPA: hypothetical protein VH208_13305 [Myxococcaceae bacterium]|nr:hypothetical protein [Myxococcaceae bacterium]